MKYFGNEILELLKKDGLHGSYFSYDEYEQLRTCKTADDFRELLQKTEYKETEVSDDAEHTYVNFSAVAKIVQNKRLGDAIGLIGLNGI